MMKRWKYFIATIPFLGAFAKTAWSALRLRRSFPGSGAYWERRYMAGGTSGSGSYNRLAEFKAKVINEFITKHEIENVIEFGCGDGNQLLLGHYPSYLGFDVSSAVIERCNTLFSMDKGKIFKNITEYSGERADLCMSLDVIYHIIEESVFDVYMRRLFDSAKKYVVVYSSDSELLNRKYGGYHVRHRKFTDWVSIHAPNWDLLEMRPNKYPFNESDPDNTSLADFYFYKLHSL